MTSLRLTARLKRRILTDQEVTKIKDETPPLKKGSNQLFRTLRDKGKFYFLLFKIKFY